MPPRTQKKPKQSESPKPNASSNPFAPSQISLALFTKLLKCYPKTVETIHHEKLSKPKSKSKAPKSQDEISTALNEFLELDKWRYETLPATVVSRVEQGEEVLSKDDLTRIMQWKTTHGHSRPMLMGMIKSNAETLVSSCVSSAVQTLPVGSFPQESLDALLPLRGVGPATASLILSILSRGPNEVPFYSDDVYLWVVDGVVPVVSDGAVSGAGVELKVKYNLKEYVALWERVRILAERLNVSFLDIEKVAYALKNIDVSGFEGDSVQVGEDEKSDRKRKVKEEDQETPGGKKKRTR